MKTPLPPRDPNAHLPSSSVKPSSSPKPFHSPTQSALLTRFPSLHRLHLLNPTLPLPSLLISFAILHELTAFVPLFGVFYSLRSVGGGRRVVQGFVDIEDTLRGRHQIDGGGGGGGGQGEREKGSVEGWLAEGEARVEKFGRRYGAFGYIKTSDLGDRWKETEARDRQQAMLGDGYDVAGDVANALGAYLIVKAFLPLRIGASLYLSPPFARTVVNPLARVFAGAWRRLKIR